MKYRAPVDAENKNSSQSALLRLVLEHCEPGARVLDLGCGAGDLGAALEEAGFQVTGIEGFSESAAVARDRLTAVIEADLDGDWASQVDGSFDAIICGDVLEHLTDSSSAVHAAKSKLAEGGVFLVSIPNVAHGSVRLALLEGRWNYTPEGLLDTTHIRFFTLASATSLVQKAGFEILSIQAPVLDVLGTEVEIDPDLLSPTAIEWVRDQEGAFDYQYVLACKVGTSPEVPEVERLIAPPRPYDDYARTADTIRRDLMLSAARLSHFQSTEGERRDELTTRDHIIGLEARAGSQAKELENCHKLIADLRDELVETHARLADAIADAQGAHARLADSIADSQGAHALAASYATALEAERDSLEGKIARGLRVPRKAAGKLKRALRG